MIDVEREYDWEQAAAPRPLSRWDWIRLAGIAGVFALVVFMLLSMPGPHAATRERIEGDVRYVDELDRDGRLHGTQQIFVGERLSAERTFEHGFLTRSIEYAPDGSIKSTRDVEL